jgi:hypothetical protein
VAGRIVLGNVDLSLSQRLGWAFVERRLDVLNVGKSLSVQQRFGNIYGCKARNRRIVDTDPGRFRWRLTASDFIPRAIAVPARAGPCRNSRRLQPFSPWPTMATLLLWWMRIPMIADA